jgi:transcriptional regulator GlxA family with amidase domain
MKKIIKHSVIPLLFLLLIFINEGCQPIKELSRIPVYNGKGRYKPSVTMYDSAKKNIIILANTEGTEIFDLLAPFYLFSATHEANVYLASETMKPISLVKGVFAMPHVTLDKFDSLGIKPDVIVLPAMVKTFNEPNSKIINWLKKHYSAKNKVLSICAGSLVGAASGIYDGKLLTTHSGDFEMSKARFKSPCWVNNVAVTKDGNLYSTAGVSNAVEGSLTIINELFGHETCHRVMTEIKYPYQTIMTSHKSKGIKTRHTMTIARKLIFKKNLRVGVLLQEGVNEFDLAAIVDTYNRSFPYSNQTVTENKPSVTSRYGLTLIPTAKLDSIKLDELHVLMAENFQKSSDQIIQYSSLDAQYIIEQCLNRISLKYGTKFQDITKLLLDYN